MVDASLALIIASQVLFYIACILGILAMRRRLRQDIERNNASPMREALMEHQTYHINPNSRVDCGEDHITYFFTAGRIVGRALLEGVPWGFHFTLPLLKILLGFPVGLDDIELIDPVMYRNLVWLVRNADVESLALDFSVTIQDAHSARVVDLVPGGSKLQVTDANKRDYVQKRARFLLVESVSEQLHAFLTGFYDLVPMELLYLFDPEEFDFLLSGSDVIDAADWERHTKHSSNLKDSHAPGLSKQRIAGFN
ncbi:hypothetical protein P43SY_000456 [Pythium insidiosum]|uniref:HECT-type E3 ubiquitin transferase n=1 Tax=Pythium insidiosum TaxID=114742 RepID=A0AAD5M2L4_PYTIN|nr:hypothetical protein P43SY_000456 [Pythium insidiosum]